MHKLKNSMNSRFSQKNYEKHITLNLVQYAYKNANLMKMMIRANFN